ncbi:MAG TPA: energy transducer TonB, partial [Candidatus Acidoferrales bacterium]|nr:energy transducer TonB [Candidatus Acidoferrales bacterium]
GGRSEELTASVWGDDNPPRVLHAAQLSLASPPPKPVRIAVEIGPDGNVISARVVQSSGDQNLDDLALDAARKTVFAPATLNGLPVHGSIVLEYPATSGSM